MNHTIFLTEHILKKNKNDRWWTFFYIEVGLLYAGFYYVLGESPITYIIKLLPKLLYDGQ